VILKIVPQPGHDCIQSINESEEKPEQKSDAAFGTIFELVSAFTEASKKLDIYYSV
jgi:hypothetical protein